MTISSQELIEKLSKLPSRHLATALVELRYTSDGIEPAIERLLAKPGERTARFRTGLKKALPGNSGGYSASHLERLLLELKDPEIDPTEGFSALLEFFKNDEPLIANYYDDDWSVESLFESTAPELLGGFASRMDEDVVVNALEDLLTEDDYLVRACAWRHVTEKLSPQSLRKLQAVLKGPKYASENPRRVAGLLESLAVSLGDIDLLEEALATGKSALESDDYVKLAQAHLSRNEFQSASERLDSDPTGRASKNYDGEKIRTRCLKQLGRTAEHFLHCWEQFIDYPTGNKFESLVRELGEEHRDTLIIKVAEHLPNTEFRPPNASLLLQLGYGESAEQYVLDNRKRLEHCLYGDLSELAGLLKSDGRNQAAVLCYRTLLEDILARGKSKAYHYAADYYQALAEIDPEHQSYVLSVRARHGRKYGFWSLVAPKS